MRVEEKIDSACRVGKTGAKETVQTSLSEGELGAKETPDSGLKGGQAIETLRDSDTGTKVGPGATPVGEVHAEGTLRGEEKTDSACRVEKTGQRRPSRPR